MNDVSFLVKERLKHIPSSLMRKLNKRYGEIGDMVMLTVGEPDFATPDHIKLAALQSILANHSHYAPNRGTGQLRSAISNYLTRRFNLNYDPNTQIVVTNGATEAISTAINGIIDQDDVVLIPSPAFNLYGIVTAQNGGIPVTINTETTGFKLTPQLLKTYLEKYHDHVKIVVLNYPNNPTGVTYNTDEIEALADVLRQYSVIVLSDEVYSELSYDIDHISIAKLLPEQTLYINSTSKSYAMTGWRVGYLCGPKSMIDLLAKVHQANVATIGTPNMDAATEAFLAGDSDFQRMKQAYVLRRDYLCDALANLGFNYIRPQGAFYIYVKVPDDFIGSAIEYTDLLANQAHVATVPSEAFEIDKSRYFRMSYATSLDNLKLAIRRISRLLSQ